ncbi:MAG: alpha/beta hydrolase [Chloroflexales bacterium]|nr:alpha/beta hydrolase [Chloroflexales bacterium]
MARRRLLEHRCATPSTRRYPRPLLLVHGAWHGAWCWAPALRDFARRGFEAHAISLRGHGASDHPGSLNFCALDDYLRDIETALAQIEPAPIVVAHSLGGFLLQHLLMRRQLPGVVLLCAIPHTGALRFLARWMGHHPGAALKTTLTLNTRHLVGTPALARAAFFGRVMPEAEVVPYAARLGPESLRVALQSVLCLPQPRPGQTPMLVVAAEHDAVFTLAEQRALAAAYGAELAIIPGAAHDLMLDPAWPLAADMIERTAAKWMGAGEVAR